MARASLAILDYHHVGFAPAGASPLTLSPRAFERQVRWLSRAGFRCVTPSQAFDFICGRASLPHRPVMITFDDGYADICEHALPVLERYGFRCAVYIVTSLLGGVSEWDAAKYVPLQLMTASDVLLWSKRGVEFGAHGRTHVSLDHADADTRCREIAGSRDDLHELLGTAPISFAYPWGTHDDEVVAAVRRHFELALTIRDGLNGRTTDLHRLFRTVVWPTDTTIDVLLRARFGTSLIHRGRRRLLGR